MVIRASIQGLLLERTGALLRACLAVVEWAAGARPASALENLLILHLKENFPCDRRPAAAARKSPFFHAIHR